MIKVEEAINKILSRAEPLGEEKVYMIEALSRVLAEDVCSGINGPLWDNSAMDGFAVRYDDIKGASEKKPVSLKVTETIAAGSFAKEAVMPGLAHQIMTGAPMPDGADTVVKKEDTTFDGEHVNIIQPYTVGKHVRLKGENFRPGDVVLKKGKVIAAGDIAMSATIGKIFMSVYKKPSVAILSTGNELKDMDSDDSDCTYDSNSYALASQVVDAGGMPHLIGIAKDNLDDICKKIELGLKFDLLLVSGGVSVGNYDFVKEAFEKLGIKLEFWKVAMRPGNPLAFGRKKEKMIFGLPGNPVSAMVTFDQFVRPLILKMMGAVITRRAEVDAVLEESISYKKGMRYFLRAIAWVSDGKIYCKTTGSQGSGNIMSLVDANAIIIKPEYKDKINAGETVRIQLLKELERCRE